MLKDPIFFLRSLIRHFLLSLTFIYGLAATILFITLYNQTLNIVGSYEITRLTFLFSVVSSFGIGFFVGERSTASLVNAMRQVWQQNLIIGIYGILFLACLPLISEISKHTFLYFENFMLVRFVLNFLTILLIISLPASMMGNQLATINRFLCESSSQRLLTLGNTFALFFAGSAIGGIFSGFTFFQFFGIKQSFISTAIVYLLIALLVRLLFQNFDFKTIKGKEHPLADRQLILFPEPHEKASSILKFSSLLAFGLIGLFWANYLVLQLRLGNFVLGTDVYARTIFIIAMLIGISSGCLIGVRILRRKQISIFPVFALIPILMGILSLVLFFQLPIFQKFNLTAFSHFQSTYFWPTKLLVYILNSLVIFGFPASLLGCGFIFFNKILNDFFETRKTYAGFSLILLSSGFSLGLISASAFFIPQFGFVKNYIFMILILFVIGLSIIFVYSIQFRKIKRTSLIFLVVLVLLVAAFFLPSNNMVQIYEHHFPDTTLVYAHENSQHTITINKQNTTNQFLLAVDGGVVTKYPLADFNVAELSAILSRMFSPDNAATILLLGSGNENLLAQLTNPAGATIDCIEPSPETIDARNLLNPASERTEHPSNCKYIFSDIYKYVKFSSRKYPAIITSCFHPQDSYNSTLFSREFFSYCRKRLQPQGVFFMPLPLFGVSIEDLKIMLKTFQDVFPALMIFYNNHEMNRYILLAGFKRQFAELDFEKIYLKMTELTIEQNPLPGGFDNIYDLLDCFIMGTEEINKLTTGVRIHTINQPILSYSTPRTFANSKNAGQVLYLLKSYREFIYPYLTNFDPDGEPRETVKMNLKRFYSSSNYLISAFVAQLLGQKENALNLFKHAYLNNRENNLAHKILTDYYDRYLIKSPTSAFELTENAKIYFQKTEYEISIDLLSRAIQVDANFAPAYFALGLNYETLGELDKAEEMYQQTLRLLPDLQVVKDRLSTLSDRYERQ